MVKNRKRRVSFRGQMGIYVLYDRFEQPVQIGQEALAAMLGKDAPGLSSE
jgi:hypothetical protein